MVRPDTERYGMGRRVLGRRRWIAAAAGLACTGVAVRVGLPIAARPGAPRAVSALSPAAKQIVDDSFRGIDRSRVWDVHAHVVGMGVGGTGCLVSDAMQSHLRPLQRLRFDMFMAASGVRDLERADAEYVERLAELARLANADGRVLLMAFDAHVREDGTQDRSRSTFFVPDAYVASLARRNPLFGFVASVHPYRRDAVERLEAAAAAGAVAVKWLPNAMGIDPMSKRCDAYYDALNRLQLVLMSHTGAEQAVHAEEAQELGNPLRLRRALDKGTRVVAAHCATLGSHRDLDAPTGAPVPAFDLFLRLMARSEYRGLLFGDISATTLRNREPGPLRTLLSSVDLHPRLLHGSDYPVIAVDPVISLSQLRGRGLLDDGDVSPLREIFEANSLLFDFVLKRRLRVLGPGGAARFSADTFETSRVFRAA